MSRGEYIVDKIHDYVMGDDEDLYLDFDDYRELNEYVQGLQPVVHAKWIPHFDDLFPTDSTIECSNCGEHSALDMPYQKYCPNCGAKCDGGE